MKTESIPNRETIEPRVIALAAEQVGADPSQVTTNTHFVQDLNYDSLERVEFAMDIEDAFGVSVPDEDAEEFQTVGNVVDYLAGL